MPELADEVTEDREDLTVEVADPSAARRDRAKRLLPDVVALLVLAAITLVVWSRPVIEHFASRRLSNPGDSNSFEFYLAWNTHAFLHLHDPFFTPVLYAPDGMDLGNAISVPAVSLLVAPVTSLFGPTAGYNVAFLLGILLPAAAVYLLARELFRSVVGAAFAGALMVVAPYQAGHAEGHLNLMWIWGLPFIAFLVARHVHGRMRLRWVAVGTAIAVAFTLGASTELFVTQSVFGVLAFAIALLFGARATRRSVLRGGLGAAIGGVAGIILGSPVIYAALRSGIPKSAANAPASYPTDLTNVFVPTNLTAVGDSFFQHLRAGWLGNSAENTAYIPVTLLFLVVVALTVWRASKLVRGLLVFAAIALVFSFGPYLTIAGQRTISMPWALAEHLPGLEQALPGRFSAFVFAAVCLLAAGAWAQRWVPRAVTGALVALSMVLLFPSLGAMAIPVNTSQPAYVTSGQLERDLKPNENVLVLPPGEFGPGMAWIAKTGFRFRMPTGNGGGASQPLALRTPAGQALFAQPFTHANYDWSKIIPPYLRTLGVHTILVDAQSPYWVKAMHRAYPGLGQLDGGVWVYRIPAH